MKCSHAVTLILLIWATIYLPHLGERELRGEEARRIVPAQEMIRTSNWVVPTIAGEHYGNKPPFINWVIAASFLLTGSESEFAARLPSALSLLLLSFAIFFVLRKEFGEQFAIAATFVLLTAIAMIDKCRTAEIESVFIALFGFACLSWIALWTSRKSPWMIWTLPYIFIGLGCLTKGPVHLPFWLFFLLPVLKSSKSLRSFFHPAHLLGLVILGLITIPWVLANLGAVDNPDSTVDNWVVEIAGRVKIDPSILASWARQPLDILLDFLPWTLPLLYSLWHLRKSKRPSASTGLQRWDAVIHGCFWSVVISTILLVLIPGGRPRYLMPLYVPAAIAVISFYFRLNEERRFAYEAFGFKTLRILAIVIPLVVVGGTIQALKKDLEPLWISTILSFTGLIACCVWLFRKNNTFNLFITTGIFVAVAFAAVNTTAVPFLRDRYHFRDGADKIQALSDGVPGKSVLYADKTFRYAIADLRGLIYYLGDNFVKQGESKELPENTGFVIGRQGSLPEMEALAASYRIDKRVDLEIKGHAVTALYLSRR
ncbi:MAG: glycosyltransferase family 39 protein [Verrucomicrobiales bacterium]|nr:glycosyltransferase family 39 protein [Verrucomicrobiales bacterium]